MQGEVVLERKRRRHSGEFRAEVVAACRRQGVSVAAVALAHGLNANLVRRWIKESTERLPVTRPMAKRVVEPLTVVPVSIASAEGRGDEAIRVDIRKAGTAVQLAWPATRVAELSELLKDLLR